MRQPMRIEPAAGQESVWDYPRPPRVELSHRHIQVIFNDVVIADTRRAQRVLETSHPPVYYLPVEDVQMQYLKRTRGATICEWKGRAIYYAVVVGNRRAETAVWSYPDPTPAFLPIKNYLAFYASKMDRCLIDGMEAHAQPGDFYGGWITEEIVGPFKGDPGTYGW